jgi:hypothetical protein
MVPLLAQGLLQVKRPLPGAGPLVEVGAPESSVKLAVKT